MPGTGKKSERYRVIAGSLRGRRIAIPAIAGVRPTPDRVRETLFNWLQSVIQGARCLDLFAGSGALGVEALSRGAAACTFVDQDPAVTGHLEGILADLGLLAGTVVCRDALSFLDDRNTPFDIVFLDPPYDEDILGKTCRLLERCGWLAPAARIYVERRAREGPPEVPPNWLLARSKHAGNVGYYLCLRGQQ